MAIVLGRRPGGSAGGGGAPSGPAGGDLGGTYPNPTVTGGQSDVEYESRGSNTILGVADKAKTIDLTAAFTQTFEADETLGDGWWVILRNASTDGTTLVVLNPAGSETIDGLTTVTMYSGESRLVICNGAGGNFNSTLLSGGFARFTADGSFVVPAGITTVTVDVVGGGGAGGGSLTTTPASGGGGGARQIRELPASLLGAAGSSVTVDIGAQVNGAAAGADGSAGNPTHFGSPALVSAFGGGGGDGAQNNTKSGGGGGGWAEVGQFADLNGSDTARGGGNAFTPPSATSYLGTGAGGQGGSSTASFGLSAEWGGGAGGGATPGAGGTSLWGAGGGGGGGHGGASSAGGDAGSFNRDGGGGGAGRAGSSGTAGGNGADGDLRICGEGGGGGERNSGGVGGAGGNGGVPGGGGGGGGRGTTTGGAGGNGARGECRVWYQ